LILKKLRVADFCVHGNEPSDSVGGETFIDHLKLSLSLSLSLKEIAGANYFSVMLSYHRTYSEIMQLELLSFADKILKLLSLPVPGSYENSNIIYLVAYTLHNWKYYGLRYKFGYTTH
jgi:hypothetical protein